MNAPVVTAAASSVDFKGLLGVVAQGKPLSQSQAEAAFGAIMAGEVTPAQIGAFLMALRVRGETVEEMTAAVKVMREKMTRVACADGAIDVCGTGGDHAGTLNISTPVALVCAAMGARVAKHGNRAASSKSGAADVLSALGVNLEADYAEQRLAFADGVAYDMTSSMHHDLERGNRLEVRWLSGGVVALGEQVDVPTPLNRAITDILALHADGRSAP